MHTRPDVEAAYLTAADMEDVLARIAAASKALILISMAKGLDDCVAAAVHGLADTIATATDDARHMAEDIARKTWGYCHGPKTQSGAARTTQQSVRIESATP